ncbi:extracellular solute-binding protein [Paenibacillus sp. IB182496]|uniref:Extracellular solute-binding protein n=1 Tax=Paenibacillus sabuli TaxID=2772509 RepID=A0A927BQU9_9BACL|nr:extracellular solute-binding protein [Paenibacillus sabuli]MBD2844251.1 extracellular solute-binding protein [Paenibacillus sabuli]
MKRASVTMVVLIAMLASLLSACGSSNNGNADNGGNGGNGQNTGGESASGDNAATGGEETVIRMASWSLADTIEPILEAYEAEHPGVTVEYIELVDNEDSVAGMQKLDLLIASGEDIDAIMLPGVTDYSKRAGLNLLAPLNELIEGEGLDYGAEYVTDTSIDGTYYALPATLENYFVLLNKDKLDAAGLEVPTEWTWTEFLEYAKALTAGEGPSKTYGTFFHTWPMYWFLGLMNQPEKNGLVNDGVLNVDSPQIRTSLELRHQAEHVDKSAVPYADTISQKLAYRPVYFTGQAAMIITGSWMISAAGGTEEFPASFTTAFAPLPSNAPGDPSGYSLANGNFVGILDKSENKQETYDFLRWYTTEGMQVKQEYSAWKQQDTDQYISAVKAQVPNPEFIDEASLTYFMKNSKSAALNIPPTYQGDLETAYTSEAEKYILGQQDLETTVANAAAELQKIVDANE